MRDGFKIKAVIPGGSSVPLLPASMLDTGLDFEAMVAAGTLLGSGGVIVIDDRTCIVDALYNVTRFYEHESCGKCTPCREGTYWMTEVFERLENGKGREKDIDLLADVSDNILGKSFCALGDAAAMPVLGAIKHFRDEFEYHVKHGKCMVNRRKEELSEVPA
jgi:NADH-quinone oxidoreductase subunit F